MARKNKQYVKFPKDPIPEFDPKAAPKSADPSKVHVDLYLHAKGVKLWHRGGMKAFAISKGKEFAADQEFEALFKNY